jgi:4-hydroxybenzoate polyprenyltransferase
MTTRALAVPPGRMLTGRFWRDYAITMRPYLLFVSGITGIAGLSFAADTPVASLLLLALVFFLAYGFGQALTDCFQLDTDRLSAPYRPLVRGTLRRGEVLGVSLTGLIASGLVLGLHNPLALALAALSIVGLVTYTWFKRRWWGGPWYNAWIVGLVLVIAYVAGSTPAALRVSPALVAAVAAAFFGYANFVLTGYYKDVGPDRATGYRTLPVVAGFGLSAVVSDVLAALALAAVALELRIAVGGGAASATLAPAAVFFAAGFAATLVAQVRGHRVHREADAHRAIVPVVHAYILLLAAVAAVQHVTWGPVLALFYLGFVVTLRSRPMQEQV